jgi:hypothetical protein
VLASGEEQAHEQKFVHMGADAISIRAVAPATAKIVPWRVLPIDWRAPPR